MKTEPRKLWVKLTDGERHERAMSATEALRRRDEAERQSKLRAKLDKGEIERRDDTGATVEVRAMEAGERQSDLFQS